MTNNNLGSEVAVVLGSGVSEDGTPHEATLQRALAGVKLAEAHPGLTIILSGGGTKTSKASVTEAEAMARIFEQHGISRQRLLLEDDSRCTMGNAVLVAARYLHGKSPRKLYIVTSPFHGARSMFYFRGVLGSAWDMELVSSDKAADDDSRGATESGGIEWGKRFLEGIQPNDLHAILTRLIEQRPIYASVKWLDPESFRISRAA